jgi:hypothetical protein
MNFVPASALADQSITKNVNTSHQNLEHFTNCTTDMADLIAVREVVSTSGASSRSLDASRVTKVHSLKALCFGILGLAAAVALIYLLVHLSAILAPLGLAAWMANGIFGITGGAAAGSLYVGLKSLAASLSSTGTDAQSNLTKKPSPTRELSDIDSDSDEK